MKTQETDTKLKVENNFIPLYYSKLPKIAQDKAQNVQQKPFN